MYMYVTFVCCWKLDQIWSNKFCFRPVDFQKRLAQNQLVKIDIKPYDFDLSKSQYCKTQTQGGIWVDRKVFKISQLVNQNGFKIFSANLIVISIILEKSIYIYMFLLIFNILSFY